MPIPPLTQKEFKHRCKKIGILPVDKYIRSNIPIRFRCTKCKAIYLSKPNDAFQRKRTTCRGCARGGYNQLSSVYYNLIKRHAQDNNRKFNITIKQLWDLFIKQKRRCALTGRPITLIIKRSIQTASLDRIDSGKPYIISNVQWLHKDINRLKNHYPEKQFIAMCVAIAQHTKSKKTDW